jgi:stearoyl-CoA desaturase (Delta-9 desaturase)
MSLAEVSRPAPPKSTLPPAWARLQRAQRIHASLVIGLPSAGAVLALALASVRGVSASALWTLGIGHALSMIGICVGFHRCFAHPGFKAPAWLQLILCGLGSTAAQGPMIFWVATHRKHHRFSDAAGDPHSPNGEGSALKRFWHAHVAWMFKEAPPNPVKYAPELLRNAALRKYSGQYYAWLLGGWILPGLILFALNPSAYSMLEGLLWGGLMRTFLVQHATWSVNSICHLRGSVAHATRERSRNNFWLAYPTFGESWHNNHHAFPLSVFHGHKWWQLDPSGLAIRLLAVTGVITDLKLPRALRQAHETEA